MLRSSICSIIIIIVLFSQIYGQQKNEMVTVGKVDLKKYAGLWYEIKKIPNSFQDDCVKGTTAEYTLMEDGKIRVINACTEEDGSRNVTEGVARINDSKTNAKLGVSFFSILGWRPIWGDYWIIGLDDNYEYAVIGTPSAKYGWVLARKKSLTDTQMKTVDEILIRNGYDPGNFKMSRQQD